MGSGGIRAVLSEQRQRRLYPLQWHDGDLGEALSQDQHGDLCQNQREDQWHSQLPLQFCWSHTPTPSLLPQCPFPAIETLTVAELQDLGDRTAESLVFEQFKMHLAQGNPPHQPLWVQPLGHGSGSELESQMQTDRPTSAPLPRFPLRVPPAALAQGLGVLLSRLSAPVPEAYPHSCISADLSPAELRQALAQITGVILSCPSHFSADYRSHLRQAVLQTGIVSQSSQIIFLEEPIAALFSQAPLPVGQVLVVHGGYSRTEIGLFNLPQGATHPSLLSLNCGQLSLTQGIIRELLYPLLPQTDPHRSALETFHLPDLSPFADLAIDEDQTLFQAQTQHWQLEQAPLGKILTQAAARLQTTLETQNQFSLRIGQHTHIIPASDWQRCILSPYQRWLEDGIHTVLQRNALSPEAIEYVMATGSLSHRPWFCAILRSLFPHAQFLTVPQEDSPLAVGLGLAKFPLYGAIVN